MANFPLKDCDIKISWIQVNGMTCMSCVNSIKDALAKIDGFINIEIYLDDGKAFLEYDNNHVTSEVIIERINEMGFECHLIKDTAANLTGNMEYSVHSGRTQTDTGYHISMSMHIEGMTCNSCVNNIETNLAKMPGVLQVTVRLLENEGTVVFDKRHTNRELILSRIDDLGFDTSAVVESILANYVDTTHQSLEIDNEDGNRASKSEFVQLQADEGAKVIFSKKTVTAKAPKCYSSLYPFFGS